MKKLFPVLVVLIIIGYIWICIHKAHEKKLPSENSHVSTDGLYIPSVYTGAFKNMATGTTFQYTGKDNVALANCLKTHCTSLYFFADWQGKVDSPSLDTQVNEASRTHAKIIHATMSDNEYADYTIEYPYQGGIRQAHYGDNLCRANKGGGEYCIPVAKTGDLVNIILSADGLNITYITFTNAIEMQVLDLKQTQ